MKLLYTDEHTSCFNYDNGYSPIIEVFIAEEDEEFDLLTRDHKLFFINKGKVSLSLNNRQEVVAANNQFTFLPSLSLLKYKAIEKTEIIIFRLREQIRLCERFSLERLANVKVELDEIEKLAFYNTNSIVANFLKDLNGRISDGLKCCYYSGLKINELMFLLRAYHKKEDLARLFRALLSTDHKFSDFIYRNYSKVKTVRELSEMANYSLSGFEKRFKKTFGVSAGVWLNKKRAMQIFHEINCSEKPFKTISAEQGFSSPAHFNDYCRSQFGDTPGKIRRNRDILDE